jgi:pilus assembly protein CpaF
MDVSKNGSKERISPTPWADDADVFRWMQRILAKDGKQLSEHNPVENGQLADGSRVIFLCQPVVKTCGFAIRKHRSERFQRNAYEQSGVAPPEFLREAEKWVLERHNLLASGATGSGKTTLLNCLTRYIDKTERVITCEDTAELQLQQPHVVRLETRPASLEGAGEITMRDLIKNCLRMRPERIIVGEVRGAEAMDLLQAMNTGHDGSMGTVHANNAREAIARIEALVNMNASNLPIRVIRDMIVSSVDVVIQVERLRDGSRRVMSVSEVLGLEGDTLVMQDLAIFKIIGEDDNGRINGQHIGTGIYRPRLWERARYFNEDARLENVMDALNAEAGQSKPRE